ncbi:glycoside hydrolase family 20 protein [Arcticibacterium luteifluviistationis]|uniref:beta-N-acetylhexosaminidase n=1 Tax=Arcticibacterium luteifluviistationis TaxID=1784714 RepID=A0A2Z4GCQ9_9BACT|nr:family 20 glycosylhydrolase [Arcticibacterium luteifluviistationis]AWV98951.1 beta-N-acetylhexosaminidase [Arcticibacterium luteifluviistationis]
MNKFLTLTFIFLSSLSFAQDIIPKPVSYTAGDGRFVFDEHTSVSVNSLDKGLMEIIANLQEAVKACSGFGVPVQKKNENSITFLHDNKLKDEAYEITVSTSKVILKAGSNKGFFYAYQSLLQLLSDEIYDRNSALVKLSLPVCNIKDEPRFVYRGLMLDVGRHMMPVSFVKKFIDLMAMYKFNQFHWHLTEDQGWRIEIKKYPKLTEIGAYRKESPLGHDSENRGDGKPYGGFYTQEEVKEVVAYATSKYINVIPEIEMPGHAVAALASYPELGCSGGPYEVRTRWGVAKDVYCPTEKTFAFLEDVLTEVMTLFPSKYIHIGGDECPKDSWKASEFCQDLIRKEGLKDEHELQSYFISRIDSFLTSKGRKLIGWDEILEGGLSPNATVMSWRGTEGGIEAAKQKHDVIMSPNSFHYLDYYQGDPISEPLAIGGFLPLEKVYSYEPLAEPLAPEELKHILGVQANLWTEYISTPEKVEYMLFPRALAVAETAWSTAENKEYSDFENRVKRHFGKLAKLKVNYAESIYNIKAALKTTNKGEVLVNLNNIETAPNILYTLDGSEPNRRSNKYDGKTGILVKKQTTVKASLFNENGQKYGNTFEADIRVNKATGKFYEYRSKKTKYTGNTEMALTDGQIGNEKNLQTWVGLEGGKLDLTIDLTAVNELSNLSIGFLHSPGSWVMFPSSLEVSVSKKGKKFKTLSSQSFNKGGELSQFVERIKVNLNGKKARYIKVTAGSFGELPEGHAGAGADAWLFVDEIEVN